MSKCSIRQREVLLVFTSSNAFIDDPPSCWTRYSFKVICFIKLVAFSIIHVPKDLSAEAFNINLIWGLNPWQIIWICGNSSNPCLRHLFTRNLYISQASYTFSSSFYLIPVISSLFWMNLDIEKYLSRKVSSNLFHVCIVPMGMDEI